MSDNAFESPKDEIDPLDLEIARYVMNRTWWAASSAVVLAVVSTCACNPLFVVTLLAAFAGLNTVMRVVGMDRELRGMISPLEVGAALALGVFGSIWAIFWPLVLLAVNVVASTT